MKKEKQVQAELPPDVVLKSDSLQKVKAWALSEAEMTKRKSSHKLREETHWKDVFFSLSDFAFIGCHNTIFSDFLKKNMFSIKNIIQVTWKSGT